MPKKIKSGVLLKPQILKLQSLTSQSNLNSVNLLKVQVKRPINISKKYLDLMFPTVSSCTSTKKAIKFSNPCK